MNEVKVRFSDGTEKLYNKGTTFEDIAKDYPGKYPYVGVKINNVIFSLADQVESDCEVNFIDFTDPTGYKIYKSGLMFIFEVALKELYPNLEVHYLHRHPKGVYGEIKGDYILTNEDFGKIKNRMSTIVSNNQRIRKYTLAKKDAIKYTSQFGYIEKAKNIQNFANKVITYYVLNKWANYYYSDMPSRTSAINIYGIKNLGNNKVVLMLPDVHSGGRVPEFVNYEGIIESFRGTQEWPDKLGKKYLCDVNDDISNSVIKDFINVNEIKFNDEIRNIVTNIVKKPSIKFVMIAGPSSSGKTTTTKRLKTYLDCAGYQTIVMSTDDYFVDRDKNPKDENGKPDFECLHAVDVNKLNKDVKDLLDGRDVTLPVYDFVTGKGSESSKTVKMAEKSIVLIEGLHSLNDDLIPVVESKNKYKIYISPFIGINIDRHNYISTTDLRLIRRIVRDNRTRGKKVEDTIDYWQTVRKGEVKNIFPYIHQADIVLNTALNYEIGVLEVYAAPLLLSVGIDSPYYEEARRLLGFLRQFSPIPSEYVSKDSILREFIGGGE